jgi:excisionase family DNA binding protein
VRQTKLSYSIDSCCEVLDLGKSTLKKFIDSGELRSFKTGNRRLISHKALTEFLQKMEERGYTPVPEKRAVEGES